MPRALNYTQACSFLQCREALLVLGSATFKHLSATAVVTTGQEGWSRLAPSRVPTGTDCCSVRWDCWAGHAQDSEAHRAGSWASLDCRKVPRQCRDSVKTCTCCPRWGVRTQTQNSIQRGRVVPFWSVLVTSEVVAVLKVLWIQEVHVQPPSSSPAPTHIYSYICRKQTKKYVQKSNEERTFRMFAPQLQ